MGTHNSVIDDPTVVVLPRTSGGATIHVASGPPGDFVAPSSVGVIRGGVQIATLTATAWAGGTITVSGAATGSADLDLVVGDQVQSIGTADAQTTAPANIQTGTTYTLAISDLGKVVTLSNASAITLTIPPFSAVAFPINAHVDLAALGAGIVTVAAGAGVTLNSAGAAVTIVGQYSTATLRQTATNVWLLSGSIA